MTWGKTQHTMSDNVNFNVLDILYKDMVDHAAIAMLGKRRAGKTTQGMRMLEDFADRCDRFLIMCGNDDTREEWMTMVDRLYVVDKNLDMLKQIFAYQAKRCAKYRRLGIPVPRKYRLTIVIDDCGGDKDFMHHKIIRMLLAEGRHFGITCVFMLQDLSQMHKQDRRNFDYIGMMYTADDDVISEVKKYYISRRTADLATFTNILGALTMNKNIMWIDNTKTPQTIEDYIYHRSEYLKDYKFKRIGSIRVHEYHNEHYIDMEKMKKKAEAKLTHSATGGDSMNYGTDEDDVDDDYYGYDSEIPNKMPRSDPDEEEDDDDALIDYLAKNRFVYKTGKRGDCVVNKLFTNGSIKSKLD